LLFPKKHTISKQYFLSKPIDFYSKLLYNIIISYHERNYEFLNKGKDFIDGARSGLSIALGYIPVSFSFGMLAVSSGIPAWAVIIISMTNLTSAGQFAGTTLIASSAPFAETAVTTLIINIRYMLMSFALSQRLEKMGLLRRMAVAFGITDEVFAVALTRQRRLTYWFMLGLIAVPYLGWTLGTVLGALAGNLLPERLTSCLGITLYAMFVAIFMPEMRKSRAVLLTVLTAAAISCALSAMSAGWSVIIAAVAASVLAAIIFPVE
jgi:4-azaleucine resistance transporter AzlC